MTMVTDENDNRVVPKESEHSVDKHRQLLMCQCSHPNFDERNFGSPGLQYLIWIMPLTLVLSYQMILNLRSHLLYQRGNLENFSNVLFSTP